MAHRTFMDQHGVSWEVWDVLPASRPRRETDRRTVARAAITERRADDGSAISVHHDLASGWLCFLAGNDKRRLAPIPGGWDCGNDDALRDLLAVAKPAVHQSMVAT